MNNTQKTTTVLYSPANQEFTAGISERSSSYNETMVNVKTLERCFNE